MKKLLCSLMLIQTLAACSTVTITPDGHNKLVSKPSYEDSKSFYLWGLVGEHHIDVTKVCDEQEPLQMQSQMTFMNGLATVLTLGIYAPHTAKVWCPAQGEQ